MSADTEQNPAGRVLDAAIDIARYVPARPGANVHAAKVAWSRIEELRDALDELGIEWR